MNDKSPRLRSLAAELGEREAPESDPPDQERKPHQGIPPSDAHNTALAEQAGEAERRRDQGISGRPPSAEAGVDHASVEAKRDEPQETSHEGAPVHRHLGLAEVAAGGDHRVLMDELNREGVKYAPESIVGISRGADGRIKFLETGNDKAGLTHIERHAPEFESLGISKDRIPDFVMAAVTEGSVVGYQGKGHGRPIMEFRYNDAVYRLAVTVGSNGFVVGANPVNSRPVTMED